MSLLARAAGFTPFGPIFGKELRVTSRRRRSYLLRVGYLGLLLMALLLAYASTGRSGGGVAAQAMAQQELGFAFFMAFTVFCVGSMGVIGPVLTANAIGAEKLAKTLPVLLMTPITAWQIVSGKLFSRVLAALTLIGLSLPVLALVRLLGGVEVEQMAAVLALAVSVVIACAALGLFYSLFITRPAIVILLSYVTLGILYWLLPAVLIILFDIGDNGPRGSMFEFQVLAALHPFGCAVGQAVPQMRGVIGDAWIASVLVQLGFAATLLGLTAVLLRRQFRGGAEGQGPAAPLLPAMPPPVVLGAGPGAVPAPSSEPLPLPLPVPAPAGTHAGGVGVSAGSGAPGGAGAAGGATAVPLGYALPGMRVRDVSDNPVLWREVRRPMLGRVWQRVVAVCGVLAILGLVYLMMGVENALDDTEAQIGFSIVMHGLWWLVAATLSATAIAQEKETDTWTLLLTTPMTGQQIVWGKAAGLLRRMLWPTALMFGHFLLFAVAGVVPVWAVLFVLYMVVACNSTWVATGIYLSLRMKKVTFAVIANLLLAVGLYGLLPLVLFIPAELVGRSGERVAEQTVWILPYYYLGEGFDGMDRQANWSRNNYGQVYYGYGRSGITEEAVYRLPGNDMSVPASTFFGFAIACGLLHLLAAYLILQRTARNFDEIVGRAGRRRFVSLTDTDGAVLLPAAGGAGGVGGAAGGHAAAGRGGAAGADAAHDAGVYASVPRRLAAWVVDVAIVQAACGLAGFAWGVVAVVSESTETYVSEQRAAPVLLAHLTTAMWAGVVVGWLYAAGFESSRRRATPGKALMGVFVTDDAGRRLSFARASGRYWAKVIGGVPLLAGYVVALFTPRRQALHDLMAGTLVLRK